MKDNEVDAVPSYKEKNPLKPGKRKSGGNNDSEKVRTTYSIYLCVLASDLLKAKANIGCFRRIPREGHGTNFA